MADSEPLGPSEPAPVSGVLGIAHDLNNLLSLIMGHISLAQGHPESTMRHLDSCLMAVEKAGQLCQRLVRLAEGLPASPQPVDAVPLLYRCLALFATSPGIRIKSEVPEDLGRVWADETELVQVFLNLVCNAKDAIDAEGGELTVMGRTEETAEGLRYAHITFQDSGPGFDPRIREALLQGGATTKGDGHGIGLLEASALLQRWGGRLEIDPKAPGGSVSIYLPLLESA